MYLPRTIDEVLLAWTPEGELDYRLLSLPLYLAEKLPSLKLGGEPGR